MGLEIEHKYLVDDTSYRLAASEHHHIVQGYLSREHGRTVRVRTCDDKGFITIAGRVNRQYFNERLYGARKEGN